MPRHFTIAIGSDHTGLAMKAALVDHLRKQGLKVEDFGTNTTDAVDYPDIAGRVAKASPARQRSSPANVCSSWASQVPAKVRFSVFLRPSMINE